MIVWFVSSTQAEGSQEMSMLISFDLHECLNIVNVMMMHQDLTLANYELLYIVCVAFRRTLKKVFEVTAMHSGTRSSRAILSLALFASQR